MAQLTRQAMAAREIIANTITQKSNKFYEVELQTLKPWDEVQRTEFEQISGYNFIPTSGHGYLVVPKGDKYYKEAWKICEYGFKGDNAVYLEEDCELSEFIKLIKEKS